MKHKSLLIPLAGGALAAAGCTDDRPNIIYVFPDQFRNSAMAFWDEEPYSKYVGWAADPVHTPNLDNFASESAVFSQAMSNCPLSSPYRGIFLTGMYPERSGVTLNCMAQRPFSNVRTDVKGLSDVLADNGYFCGYIGKLHADCPTPNDPENPGHYVSDRDPEWDAYTPKERRHGYKWWYSYGTFDEHKNPHYWDTEGHRHDPHEFSVKHEVDKAIEFLQERDRHDKSIFHRRKPFLLSVAFNPPHSPYSGPEDCMEEDYNLYKDKSLKELYVRENADTTLEKAPSIRYYFANVTAVDREFGRLLAALKEYGMDKNTIVVFTSDHGETMCSHSTSDPKNSIWTESFNVPFIIRYPGKIRPRVDDTLFGTVDITPTLLGLAGLGDKIPSTAEGMDISGEILELPGEHETPSSILYIRNVNGKTDSNGVVKDWFPEARGIRTGRYTYEITVDRSYNIVRTLLYDDRNDPYQMHNITAEENPMLHYRLTSIMENKLKEVDDIWYGKFILSKVPNYRDIKIMEEYEYRRRAEKFRKDR